MSCKYKNKCPSYSGWCEGPKQDFSRCIPFLVTAYDGAMDKLKEYEGTGLTPEQMRQIDKEYSSLAKEVAQLRNAGRISKGGKAGHE